MSQQPPPKKNYYKKRTHPTKVTSYLEDDVYAAFQVKLQACRQSESWLVNYYLSKVLIKLPNEHQDAPIKVKNPPQ